MANTCIIELWICRRDRILEVGSDPAAVYKTYDVVFRPIGFTATLKTTGCSHYHETFNGAAACRTKLAGQFKGMDVRIVPFEEDISEVVIGRVADLVIEHKGKCPCDCHSVGDNEPRHVTCRDCWISVIRKVAKR